MNIVTPHPHVHVIVNLVSAQDGRNLTVHADRNKLSAWTSTYRRERGEEHLYCPQRAKRAEAAERTNDSFLRLTSTVKDNPR